ncbi:uncharacterized protein LOC143209419 [Lasioglossum baleicum]|uniref:uncharacterized protein LOC143209419 n=1 Tax=Lasioglossum baleicum TaxID=434251 RepID=UPI003FCDFBB6
MAPRLPPPFFSIFYGRRSQEFPELEETRQRDKFAQDLKRGTRNAEIAWMVSTKKPVESFNYSRRRIQRHTQLAY